MELRWEYLGFLPMIILVVLVFALLFHLATEMLIWAFGKKIVIGAFVIALITVVSFFWALSGVLN